MSENNNYHADSNTANSLEVERVQFEKEYCALQPDITIGFALEHNRLSNAEYLKKHGETYDVLCRRFTEEVSKMDTGLKALFSNIEEMNDRLKRNSL